MKDFIGKLGNISREKLILVSCLLGIIYLYLTGYYASYFFLPEINPHEFAIGAIITGLASVATIYFSLKNKKHRPYLLLTAAPTLTLILTNLIYLIIIFFTDGFKFITSTVAIIDALFLILYGVIFVKLFQFKKASLYLLMLILATSPASFMLIRGTAEESKFLKHATDSEDPLFLTITDIVYKKESSNLIVYVNPEAPQLKIPQEKLNCLTLREKSPEKDQPTKIFKSSVVFPQGIEISPHSAEIPTFYFSAKIRPDVDHINPAKLEVKYDSSCINSLAPKNTQTK